MPPKSPIILGENYGTFFAAQPLNERAAEIAQARLEREALQTSKKIFSAYTDQGVGIQCSEKITRLKTEIRKIFIEKYTEYTEYTARHPKDIQRCKAKLEELMNAVRLDFMDMSPTPYFDQHVLDTLEKTIKALIQENFKSTDGLVEPEHPSIYYQP